MTIVTLLYTLATRLVLFEKSNRPLITHRKKIKHIKKGVLLSIVLLLALFFIQPVPLHFRASYSTVITDTHNTILRVFLTDDEQFCLPPDDSIDVPDKLITSVVAYEDNYFFIHPGINPLSIVRALYNNMSKGTITSGASTITMQLARIHKGRSRTVFNKIIEMFESIRYELHLSKSEILKAYLNHAPYGGNIIGYRTASQKYYKKEVSQLTWAEATLFAVLPNAPSDLNLIKNRSRLIKKRNTLLQKLLDQGTISSSIYELSLLESLPGLPESFPFEAQHISRHLKNSFPHASAPIKTSIDGEIQKRTQKKLTQHLQHLSQFGIENGAVLIVENSTGLVRAYCGSQQFTDLKHTGMVDGVRASRSSGSILKPFLYALAMDQGHISPWSTLLDIPSYYDSYSPHNASDEFDGIVTLEEALTRSLNVPAVRMLFTIGVNSFYQFLKDAEVTTLTRSPGGYGLPLILGGVEVNLWDMVQLYRALSLKGSFSNISVLQQDTTSKRILSPTSSESILKIISRVDRPGVEEYWDRFSGKTDIAWKTGTSYGHKDAWAMGTNAHYTIGVWIGNFDGTSNTNLAGARSAGPLLFELFSSLVNTENYDWINSPSPDLPRATICQKTGYTASKNCPTVDTLLYAQSNKLALCPYHVSYTINSDSSYRVCSRCWNNKHHAASYLKYPPAVINVFRKKGIPFIPIPPHNPHCPVIQNDNELAITYPPNKANIIIARDYNEAYQKIVLTAAHQQSNATIYWYLNDHYLGTTTSKHTMAVTSKVGPQLLTILDQQGSQISQNFNVVLAQ